MEAYGIVRIVFLYEPAQDLPGRVPVSARGRHKAALSALVGSGTLTSAATTAKCASASSICPDWRYTLPSGERSSPLVVAVLDDDDDDDDCLCCC
jgi:hypothetical protein